MLKSLFLIFYFDVNFLFSFRISGAIKYFDNYMSVDKLVEEMTEGYITAKLLLYRITHI